MQQDFKSKNEIQLALTFKFFKRVYIKFIKTIFSFYG